VYSSETTEGECGMAGVVGPDGPHGEIAVAGGTSVADTTPVDSGSRELGSVLDRAAAASEAWGASSASVRASALRAVADALDGASSELIPLAAEESHLPLPRLTGEVSRTTWQLRLFAQVLEDGGYLEATIDHSDPEWPSGPRPDLRRVLVPLGPAVVFSAGNFPFAFSVAGGDTASALAAGCPVVVKAHPGHPRLSVRTGEVVAAALEGAGAAEGTFAVVLGEEEGRRAVQDRRVKVGAFTGSLRGGRALFDLAASRPDPIPFYGELGSLNPVFVTEAAAGARMDEIVSGYVASFTFGAGQLCTKPGVLFVPVEAYDESTLAEVVAAQPSAPLLNEHTELGYRSTLESLRAHRSVRVVIGGSGGASPMPTLLATTAAALLETPNELLTECFGPTSLVVTYTDAEQLLDVAAAFEGQLTATIHGEDDDPQVPALMDVASRRAGRVVWNSWPTGVSVTWAMVHGGPWPATTTPTATSVGTTAIARFLRPVAYQDVPDTLLPPALQEANPLGIPRRVDGQLQGGC